MTILPSRGNAPGRLVFGELSFPAWCGILKRSNHTAARRKGAPLKWRTAQNGALCQAYGKNGLHGQCGQRTVRVHDQPGHHLLQRRFPRQRGPAGGHHPQLADEVLRTDTRGVEALQHGPIEGIRDLREVVVRELLAPKGIDCGVDNVIIITGGLEGINLACQAYIDPGDVILVEAPTFVQSVEIFDMFEAKCVGVAMDDDGLIPEDLERKIRQCHPKMIYVIPTFQNPSGRTLSLERRKAVAELAAKYDVLVLEDDPYRDIRYSGEDLPPIKHFDTTGHVVMAGSFSKIFSPGSRLGYVVADTETIQHLVDVKSATNSHTSMLPQILCAEFFKRGCYPAHHQMICDLYRRRRDVMLQSIDRYFPAGTKHSNPDGGLFTWVELPGGIDTSALLQESSTDPAVNVAFVAGEGFFSDRDGQGKNCMRMSFGNTPEDLIEEGVRRLGGLICSKLNK